MHPQDGSSPAWALSHNCRKQEPRNSHEGNQQRRFPYHRVPISRNWYEEFARDICERNPSKEPTALYVLVVTRNHCRRDSCKETTTTRHSYKTFAKKNTRNNLRRPTSTDQFPYRLLTPDLDFEDPLADYKNKLRHALGPYCKKCKIVTKGLVLYCFS